MYMCCVASESIWTFMINKEIPESVSLNILFLTTFQLTSEQCSILAARAAAVALPRTSLSPAHFYWFSK
jgi:hypothetical protein